MSSVFCACLLLFMVFFPPYGFGFMPLVKPLLSIKVILKISAGITVTVAFLWLLPTVCSAQESFAAWTLACADEARATA